MVNQTTNWASALAACRSPTYARATTLASPYPKRRSEKLVKLLLAKGLTGAWTLGQGTTSGLLMTNREIYFVKHGL